MVVMASGERRDGRRSGRGRSILVFALVRFCGLGIGVRGKMLMREQSYEYYRLSL